MKKTILLLMLLPSSSFIFCSEDCNGATITLASHNYELEDNTHAIAFTSNVYLKYICSDPSWNLKKSNDK